MAASFLVVPSGLSAVKDFINLSPFSNLTLTIIWNDIVVIEKVQKNGEAGSLRGGKLNMALGRKKEDIYFGMFRDFAKAISDMGENFGTIINNYHNIERAVADMKIAETECDGRSHKILEKLNDSFVTPFDREDIHAIVGQLDDIADYLEDTASKFIIYDVRELRQDAVELGNIIVDSCRQVQVLFDMLPDAKAGEKAKESIIEINRLENLADAVFRRALTKLFHEEKDAIELVRWKDIYETLEDTLDACEHLADTVEGVMMKNA